MAKVLIIDDDTEMCSMLTDLIRSVNHHAESASTLARGRAMAAAGGFDVVFLDVRMPDGSGLDIIPGILDMEFPPEIIVITGQGDSADAEAAIKKGAWDYIQKPLSPKRIIEPLNRILQYRDGVRAAALPPGKELKREEIIGDSRQVRDCLNLVSRAANSDANVLITGETGTGKELFARAIHENSRRSSGRFVVVDCAALTETLVESALFGHEKGAFTGADRSARGLVSLAHQGTLFLDEVTEMDPALQKVFLRVLQERRFRPVGSKQEEHSDFRVIAATNRRPEEMVAEHKFREDLYYRLNGIALRLPPLRDRAGDIRLLAGHLTSRACARLDLAPKTMARDFRHALDQYHWPGNVRQLVNAVDASVGNAYYESTLFFKHLPETVRIALAQSAVAAPAEHRADPEGPDTASDAGTGLPTYKAMRETALSRAEGPYLRELMRHARGDIPAACGISGLGRSRLYALMKKHGIGRMGWD